MKIGKETIETFYRFDVDLSQKEHTALRNYGLNLIKNDDAALINYAANAILRKAVDKKEMACEKKNDKKRNKTAQKKRSKSEK